MLYLTRNSLKFAHKYTVNSAIHSLTMTSEEKHLLVGLADGNLLIIARPNMPKQKKSKTKDVPS